MAYDLAILGSGPGGYVAAIRAAQLGLKVAVVERDALGGICANWGCIPTKALLRTAELLELAHHAADLGIKVEAVRPEFDKVIARSRKVADRQAKGVEYLFKKNKIDTLRGTGKLARVNGRVVLTVDGKPIDAPNVMVATGARPKPLPGLEHDGKQIISYKEAMALPTQPARIVIIGAGAIGVEFAYFYNAVGTKVVLLEALPQILPVEDEEVSVALQKNLVAQGIEVTTSAKVEKVEKGERVRVHLTDGKGAPKTIEAELCLLAAGVRGNVEGIGLEECGVKLERGFIAVDRATYRTSVENVYAIGDVIGPPMLAHKASAEGVACVEALAKHPVHAVDYQAIPGCTYCRPEVASVGLTEKQAREKGLQFKVGRFPFKASGKAMAASETEGFVKVLVGEPHGELLGAHVLGGASTDMVATLTLAMSSELTSDEILSTVFAHPTFAEAIKEAVADAHGEAIDL
jgi:dihydrolipoamide dehydrogenase